MSAPILHLTVSQRPVFLLNSCLSLFSVTTLVAPLIPKLRGHFAEFLNNTSPVGLWIFSSSTCVGLRYGLTCKVLKPFLVSVIAPTSLLIFHYALRLQSFLFLDWIYLLRQLKLVIYIRCRNFYLLSIDYASRPRLRSRLTLGGRTFPKKP